MSALAKLMEARKRFHKRELKKTGWNDFSKFNYLELSDFLIPAMEIFNDLQLATLTSFTKEVATMTITDLEDGSSIQITSPFGSAALKACHEVQNIGAVETYQRRYLWVAALEIVEHDALDASVGIDKSKVQPTKTGWTPSEEEREHLNKELGVIRDLLNADQAKDAADYFYRQNGMDQEEQLFVWNQLSAPERKSIKAHKESK